MYCNKCGAYIPDEYEFCMKCGTKAEKGTVEQKADNFSSNVINSNKDNSVLKAEETIDKIHTNVKTAAVIFVLFILTVGLFVFSANKMNSGIVSKNGYYLNMPWGTDKNTVKKTLIADNSNVEFRLDGEGYLYADVEDYDGIDDLHLHISCYFDRSGGLEDVYLTFSTYSYSDLKLTAQKVSDKCNKYFDYNYEKDEWYSPDSTIYLSDTGDELDVSISQRYNY